VKYLLPQQEIEIGKRLRSFRERRRIPRTAFALEIGISSERLATYEAGRARLPYVTYAKIANRFRINPVWLATGTGDPESALQFADPVCEPPLSLRTSFSKAFEGFLNDPLGNDAREMESHVVALYAAAKDLNAILHKRRNASSRLALCKNAQQLITLIQSTMPFLLDELERDTAALPSSEVSGIAAPVGPHTPLLEENDDRFRKKDLTLSSLSSNVSGMKSPLQDLLARLENVTAKRGAKAALAAFLGVDRARITEWTSGAKEPGGDYALRLLEWVTAEEAAQKNRGSVTSTTTGLKTRSTQSKHEKSKASPK
jgi:transcriptional regulator with XRE-family HTH domain